MVEKRCLIDRARVIIEAARDCEVDRKILLRHAEGRKVLRHRRELVEAEIERFVSAAIALEAFQYLRVCAADGDKLQNLVRKLPAQATVVHENFSDLLGANLIELVDRAHDVARLFG